MLKTTRCSVAMLAIVLAGPAFAAPMLTGAVKTPLMLDEATLSGLPKKTIDITFQSSKGSETGTYTGVLLWDLLAKAGLVNADGKNTQLRHSLMVTGADGYAVAIAEGELDPNYADKAVVLAFEGGKASYEHLRVLVPGDAHGGRAVSDVASIEVK